MTRGHLATPPKSRFMPATDAEVFRAPLRATTDTTDETRATALAVIKRRAGKHSTLIAKMLGLVPA